MQAGRQLLGSEGPKSLTTNRIAERAGVSIGSLYRYFPNKDAVLAAIYDAETGREVADIQATTAWQIDEAPLHEALVAFFDVADPAELINRGNTSSETRTTRLWKTPPADWKSPLN